MGITRKLLSLFTVGLVDFRSDKERTAAYTHGVLRQQKKQTRILSKQAGQQNREQPPAQPGWVDDPQDHRYVRWFDGRQLVGEPRPRV